MWKTTQKKKKSITNEEERKSYIIKTKSQLVQILAAMFHAILRILLSTWSKKNINKTFFPWLLHENVFHVPPTIQDIAD